METTNFVVPSITCSVCSNKIQEGLRSVPGVGNVSVDLKTKQVNVEYNPTNINAHQIMSKVASLGYEVIE